MKRLLTGVAVLVLWASIPAFAEEDQFYLPQKEQPFDGKVETRIGTLDFENQYPSQESLTTLLDSIDFHGATQSFIWGIPIASFANLQHYLHDVFKFDQVDLMETATLKDKLGILTANATTPYIFSTPDLSKTGPVVIEVPAGSIAGMVDDFWQRPVTDLGLPGPDKGKGGKYHRGRVGQLDDERLTVFEVNFLQLRLQGLHAVPSPTA